MNKAKVEAALNAALLVAEAQTSVIESAIAFNSRLAEELEVLATKPTPPVGQPAPAPAEGEDDDTDDKLMALAETLRANNDRLRSAFKLNTPDDGNEEGPQDGKAEDEAPASTSADPAPAAADPAPAEGSTDPNAGDPSEGG